MTSLPCSFAPTVRGGSESQWPTSASLSVHSNRASDDDRLWVRFDPSSFSPQHYILGVASDSLGSLLALGEGWDGRRAKRVSRVAAILSLHLISYLVDDVLQVPHLFPLPDGGIQLEWLVGGSGLEIVVSSSGEVSVIGVDATGLTQVEEEFGSGTGGRALQMTKEYLRVISKPLFADR